MLTTCHTKLGLALASSELVEGSIFLINLFYCYVVIVSVNICDADCRVVKSGFARTTTLAPEKANGA